MGPATTLPYHAVFYIALSIYGTSVYYFWKPVFSGGDRRHNKDALALMTLVTILGALWLASAYAEGVYLERRIGKFIPEQFHYQVGALLSILAIWGLLMAFAANGWVLPYCTLYFVYVSVASFLSQPRINRTIVEVVTQAEAMAEVPSPTAEAIIDFYHSSHWIVVAGESVFFAALALIVAYLRRKQGLARWTGLWRSPHLFLIIEFTLSQCIIWYHRIKSYDQF